MINVAIEIGVAAFGMFDFALPVVMVSVVAILYLWLLAPRMIPDRQPPINHVSDREFTAELRVIEQGFSDRKSLAEIRNKTHDQLHVQRIIRGKNTINALPDVGIKASDKLLVTDTSFALRGYEVELDVILEAGIEEQDAIDKDASE